MFFCLTFQRNLFFKSDDGHAISRQDKRRLPKSTARFPAKKRWYSQLPAWLSSDSPPPPPESVRQAYADVTTKISQIDRLPNFPSNGAALVGFARGLRYKLNSF